MRAHVMDGAQVSTPAGEAFPILAGIFTVAAGMGCELPRGMPRDLDARLLRFASRAVDIYDRLNRRGGAAREVARQYLRSATSVGANYAEAAAGQTTPDFIARVAVARKECRASMFWLQLIGEKEMLPKEIAADDLSEARQLAAILAAIVRKAKRSNSRGDES